MKNREGYYVTEFERECTSCGTVFKRTSKTVALCGECNSRRVKEEAPEKRMFRRAKSRAKERGIPFELSLEDIQIPPKCPILGVELQPHSGKSGGKPNSPSLDRKDNSKGYSKDNIQVISHLANCMKASATPEEMKAFARWVLENY